MKKTRGIAGCALFMYLAPESGYDPKFVMNVVPNEATWTPLAKKQFFSLLAGRQDLWPDAAGGERDLQRQERA